MGWWCVVCGGGACGVGGVLGWIEPEFLYSVGARGCERRGCPVVPACEWAGWLAGGLTSMSIGSLAISGLYGLAALSGVVVGYIVWQNRRQPGAVSLLAVVCGAWWWCAALFVAANTGSFTASMWLQRSTYIGVAVIVAGMLLFSLEYSGRQAWLRWWVVGLIGVHPVAVTILVVLNPGDVFFRMIESASVAATVTGVVFAFGPAFWLHAVYSYTMLTVALLIVFQVAYSSRRLYRWQFVLLFAAIIVASATNYLYIAGPLSFDAGPIGVLVAAGLFTVAITRYQLMDLAPIARDQLVDDINDAVFVVDHADRLVDVNPAGQVLLRRPTAKRELIGTDFPSRFEAVMDAEGVYQEVTATREEQEFEVSVQDRYYDVSVTPIADPEADRPGWLFLVRDVSERVRRERELQRRNTQLDRFASVVSHDLRNPLGVAQGYVQLARETEDVSHLEEVATAHERMDTIIDDVLTLAREGLAETEPDPVSLEAVARDAWLSVDTPACELDVERDVDILADRDRLQRVFENLFRNAVEHGLPAASSDGGTQGRDTEGVALSVMVGVTEAGFYVADDGVGFGTDDPAALLERGYSTSGDGTGTGLAIVRQLAEAHDWTVSVQASAAGGGRFDFQGVDRADT